MNGGSSGNSVASGDPSPSQGSPPDTMGDVYAAWRKFNTIFYQPNAKNLPVCDDYLLNMRKKSAGFGQIAAEPESRTTFDIFSTEKNNSRLSYRNGHMHV